MQFKTNNRQIKQYLELFGIYVDPIIGIDISSSAVKILELGMRDNRYFIENFAVETLQVGDVVEKNIRNKDAVIKALEKALIKSKSYSRLGCISIPNAAAISKIIQLDKDLSDKEILSEITVDADRYIPYDLDDVHLDFEVLGPSKVNVKFVDVLLVVSKKENINTRVNILENVGIKTHIVDTEALSLERVFNKFVAKQLPEQGKDQLVALMDIGATSIGLNIFDNLRSVYTKDQAFGGQQLLDEIQKRYGLSLKEAMLAVKHHDLPEDYQIDVLEPFRVKLAQQIVRSCQLFLSSSEYKKIDYVVLSGGASNIDGLDELIKEMLKIKVITVNPFANIAVAEHIPINNLDEFASGLLNCCGLALRNFEVQS